QQRLRNVICVMGKGYAGKFVLRRDLQDVPIASFSRFFLEIGRLFPPLDRFDKKRNLSIVAKFSNKGFLLQRFLTAQIVIYVQGRCPESKVRQKHQESRRIGPARISHEDSLSFAKQFVSSHEIANAFGNRLDV